MHNTFTSYNTPIDVHNSILIKTEVLFSPCENYTA